ncbi:ATP-dependent RNA helicase HrpA [Salmonella enterica subsp. enterica]|uniref:ATP-dependent RNA helicase HrpA n=1 Tax=Salmonella enterica I TaxID=59201 RepID=A0A447U2S0_SALET|nr:ATP-dependent RNA helicase HrpA [Salmonella enterica subsp. enterica]
MTKTRKLQEGRSLAELKNALKGKVQETLSAVADDGIRAERAAYLEFRRAAGKLRTETR